MSDYTWLANLFTAAEGLQLKLTPGQHVSVNVSVVTNEMGGSVVVGGTVTYTAGSLVYQPERVIPNNPGHPGSGFKRFPASFSSAGVYNPLLRKNLDTNNIDNIAVSISAAAFTSGFAPEISVNLTTPQGTLTSLNILKGVDTAANVLFGTASDGLASGSPALYVIAPFNPEIQTPGS